MLTRFREYYQDDRVQMDRLSEFASTYESEHALWWYTKPSFISGIVNKALRARDIDALFDLRYCIVDLCQLLEERPRPTEPLSLHRTVLMDRDKFNKMKESMAPGDLLSTRGFLSTSLNHNAAKKFGSNDGNDPSKVENSHSLLKKSTKC